jgi:uncharacterized protein DUF2782
MNLMQALTPLRFTLLIFSVASIVQAADRDPVPPPPPLPPEQRSSSVPDPNAPEPEITITSKGTEIHEEYRYHGELYMVKVIPAKGPPYYLIYDERGNSRRSDIEPDIIAPSWVIKRF